MNTVIQVVLLLVIMYMIDKQEPFFEHNPLVELLFFAAIIYFFNIDKVVMLEFAIIFSLGRIYEQRYVKT